MTFSCNDRNKAENQHNKTLYVTLHCVCLLGYWCSRILISFMSECRLLLTSNCSRNGRTNFLVWRCSLVTARFQIHLKKVEMGVYNKQGFIILLFDLIMKVSCHYVGKLPKVPRQLRKDATSVTHFLLTPLTRTPEQKW